MIAFATRIPLPRKMPPVLGAGAFLKNTLCLIQGNEAFVSQDNGSLDNVAAIDRYEKTAKEILNAAKEKPVAVAYDLHPDFPCTRFALTCGLKPIAIQHHHAHIAAIMAEHGLDEPVLGLALDGFGLGLNNESWGGELLRVDAKGFERIGHLYPLLQPGGDIAARQPWRMGAAALWSMGRGHEIAARYKDFPNAEILPSMMERSLNSPLTSSAGRLFDAACGLLNVKPVAAFEGEAPMALEGMVRKTCVDESGWVIAQASNQAPLMLDLRPLLERLLDCEAQEGAEIFHGTLIAALTDWTQKAAHRTGIKTVALGGGCFYNKILREGLRQHLTKLHLKPLLPQQLPAGDPAISLGQAWAAALSLEKML